MSDRRHKELIERVERLERDVERAHGDASGWTGAQGVRRYHDEHYDQIVPDVRQLTLEWGQFVATRHPTRDARFENVWEIQVPWELGGKYLGYPPDHAESRRAAAQLDWIEEEQVKFFTIFANAGEALRSRHSEGMHNEVIRVRDLYVYTLCVRRLLATEEDELRHALEHNAPALRNGVPSEFSWPRWGTEGRRYLGQGGTGAAKLGHEAQGHQLNDCE